LGKLVFLTDIGSGRCDVINDVVKFSLSNGYISATDRPIDFVFDPRVGFPGTADRLDVLPVSPNPRWRLYGVSIWSSQIVDTDLMTSLMTPSYNNLSRHFNTMFPCMMCLYIPHVPFGVKVNTFSPASERTMSPTGLSVFLWLFFICK